MGDAPKSAFEIAMEKLRTKDIESGEAPSRKLKPAEKRKIAEIRSFYEAKIAEREILHRSEMRGRIDDPAKIEEIEANYRTDRRRLESERDEKIAKIRG